MSPVPDADRSEQGSAVVEFVLVSVLVVALLLAVVQVGLALHVRNTLISAAGEGARFAAAANQPPSAGEQHTRQLIQQSLPDSYAANIVAGHESVAGVETVVVVVEAELPLLGWLGVSRALRVEGHAMEES